MSKTVSTCVLETNLVPNQPQENIFFHTLYRTKEDFPGEFMRTARSTSPIQVVALFSTQGPDTEAAFLNIELNKELSKIVANAQSLPVLDFETFSNQVVSVLNGFVCNYVVAHGGKQLRTSMTMAVIEGDTLRIIHIGNTKAVLVRDGKVMALTEDQTVAHRYVQMGAITPADEASHPDRFSLIQYLGKMPQDGAIVPEKKLHLKLKDNDSLCLMGIGISKFMPVKNRNAILLKPMSTESKAHEIITSAGNIGVKFGLSVAIIEVESTLILPGDAVMASKDTSDTEEESLFVNNPDPFGAEEHDNSSAETTVFNRGASKADDRYDTYVPSEPVKANKKPVIKTIITTLIIFLICIALGFGAMFAIFRFKGLIDLSSEPSEVVVENVRYISVDNTPVYSQPSDGTVIATLSAGEVVQFIDDDGTYSKIVTTSGTPGYILNVNLSTEAVVAADPVVETVAPDAQQMSTEEGELEVMDDPNSMAGEPDSQANAGSETNVDETSGAEEAIVEG